MNKPEHYIEPKVCKFCKYAKRIFGSPSECYYCEQHCFYPDNYGVCNDHDYNK